jgi:L-alanine-DL-glutamate epimerase-like enolase superfamily enzyme
MRITNLEVWPVRMQLREPYTIAYETVTSTTNVFLRLHTDCPLIGYGCAAPEFFVTGETPETVVNALENVVKPAVLGLDPTRPAAIFERLKKELGYQPSALAGIDMAVWDLLGKAAQLPLRKLLGGNKERIRTCMTIGILGAEETVAEARRWQRQGFAWLKIKGGLDVEQDIQRVRQVREVVGSEVQLVFDANQGYSREMFWEFVRGIDNTALAFIEQPTPKADFWLLDAIQRESPIPIMADESLTTAGQALQLAMPKRVELFNIKLMKVGGISGALVVDAIAESARIRVMAGCMDESALGIAAGLHFALGRPNVHYADLDSHFALLDDPAAGAVQCREGFLYPNDGPGLGFNLEFPG